MSVRLKKMSWAFALVLLCCSTLNAANDEELSEQESMEETPVVFVAKRFRCGRPISRHPDSQSAFDCGLRGVWLPADPPLFRPFVADPRQLTYSFGRRFNDRAITKNVIPVSFWSTIPLYRWFDIGPCHGMLQIDLDGAVWAIFDPDDFSSPYESLPLINADYYVGLPLTYAFCKWSFRLRVFHVSSHLGDEYMVNNPNLKRLNPSSETVDFFASYYLTKQIRLFAGVGYIVHQDKSFPCSKFSADAGLEVRLQSLGFCNCCHKLAGRPFYAMYFRYKTDFKRHVDATYALGYEIEKCWAYRERWRLFIEYHDGYSFDGQFCNEPTNYFGFRITYGY
ncbi:MAG: DUF1207 domain-containing protein [Waddliaceae bacterium]